MGFLGKIWAYLSGALMIVVIVLAFTLHSYKKEIRELTMDSLVDQLNISSLEDAIIKYNLVVEEEKVDLKKRNKEFLESQKPKVVIEYINKYIPQGDSNATECEVIDDILTNVRFFGI